MAEASRQVLDQPDDSDELSFAALRRLGIACAQEFAGENWSDFNVHDPGVTILEQICYALTDLVYRSEFDVADHLTSPDGEIDFAHLALELPERIFPCRPATPVDYRRVILDAVAALDDVAIRPMATDRGGKRLPTGLYQILLRPRPTTGEREREEILAAAARLFSRTRNLCEDVYEIACFDELEFDICADVEVARGRDPGEILAEIYHRCAEHVTSRVRFSPFEEARREDRPLEELFTGPLSQRGFYAGKDTASVAASYSVADLFSLLSGIEGVAYLRDLYFRIDGKIRRDSISAGAPDRVLRLRLPGAPEQVQIRLTSLGRMLHPPFEPFKHRLDALVLKSSGADYAVQDLRKLYTAPRGEHLDLQQYTSIQAHLPSVYRVGAVGLTESVAPEVRARSRQLKGYLLLFDQMIADTAADLAHLSSLYSLDDGDKSTYASQLLDRSQVSGLDGIYPAQAAEVVASAVARYDNFYERKGRLLDYLLALYGESFHQSSLRAFNSYALPGEREPALVEYKARFLRAIAQLTRDRGAACDYLDPDQATASGLQQRVSCLLGFTDDRSRSLTESFSEHGLRPLPDDLIVGSHADEAEPGRCGSADFVPPDKAWEDEVPVLAEEDSAEPGVGVQALPQLMGQVGRLLPKRAGKVAETVLHRGISLANYRLGHVKGSSDWQAFLLPDGDAPWWRLGAFADRRAAIEAVNRLRRLIVLLNTGSEGMHVVEHLLLRPRSQGVKSGAADIVEHDFFSLRLTVLFPAWTARFQDPRFRQLARETVRLNCPAHLVPEVNWLQFDDMQVFEQLQAEWVQTYRDAAAHPAELDAAAERLVSFLTARRGEACWALTPAFDDGQAPGA
ncbi:MAG: hypothetical protein KDI49_08655 [Gammaproteobacteria bacterium]|nr:hypothetical protein [Gammaproteobacteria bacterium]